MSNRFRRPLTVGALAAACLLSACTDGGETDEAQLSSEVVDTGTSSGSSSSGGSSTGGSDGSEASPQSLASVSPIGELEESPAAEPETLTEQLAASDFVESEATDQEVEAIAQTTCEGLVDTIVATHQQLLDELGDAGRDDDRAVDTAFEQFGLNGALIARKANELECGQADIDVQVCAATGSLTPSGDVGADLVALLSTGC